jgi:hypothetical protein
MEIMGMFSPTIKSILNMATPSKSPTLGDIVGNEMWTGQSWVPLMNNGSISAAPMQHTASVSAPTPLQQWMHSTNGISNPSGNLTVANSMLNEQYNTHAIQGKMFVVQQSYNRVLLEDDLITSNQVKTDLMLMLLEEMKKTAHIEFTKEDNHYTDNVICRARIFVTPNDQVKILKTIKTIGL